MKKVLLSALAAGILLAQGVAFADSSKIIIKNGTEYPMEIAEMKKVTGYKVVPTYAPKLRLSLKDLKEPGFRCYLRATNWVCIREGRRQVVQNSLRTKKITKMGRKKLPVVIEPNKKKDVTSVDRDQKSIKYDRWWTKKGVIDREWVPAKFRKALSREYPFESKRIKIEIAGGTIELGVVAERGGSLDMVKQVIKAAIVTGSAATVAGLALPGGPIIAPLHIAPGAAAAGAIAAAIAMDQRSFLTWRYETKGLKDVKIEFKRKGLGKWYKDLEIIVNRVVPEKDVYEREWYEDTTRQRTGQEGIEWRAPQTMYSN